MTNSTLTISSKRGRRALDIRDVVSDLVNCGYLCNTVEVSQDAIVCDATQFWSEAARELSTRVGGQVRWSGAGISVNLGGKTAYLVNSERADAIAEARQLVHGVTGAECGWTMGACARSIWEWIGHKQAASKSDEKLLQGTTLGYHESRPGTYERAYCMDLKACYFNLFRRIGTLNVRVWADGSLCMDRMQPQSEERLDYALDTVADNKLLRNCMFGAALGSLNPGTYYRHGELCESAPYPGPLRATALLVGRLAWELTRNACEEHDAVYAQTDCIISTRCDVVRVWDKYDLPYETEAAGTADIKGQHGYRVGRKRTKYYRSRASCSPPVPRAPFPARCYLREVLH